MIKFMVVIWVYKAHVEVNKWDKTQIFSMVASSL